MYRTLTPSKLEAILDDHLKWVRGEGGARADLSRANLSNTDLCWATLNGAHLRKTNLCKANLRAANLCRADLRGAHLSGANLTGATLRGAQVSYEALVSANTSAIARDVWDVLDHAQNEADGLLKALLAGHVEGSAYSGLCACLVGTLANVRGCHYQQLPGIVPRALRPAERWFVAIREGDTPENSPFSRLAAEWVMQWLARK